MADLLGGEDATGRVDPLDGFTKHGVPVRQSCSYWYSSGQTYKKAEKKTGEMMRLIR